ncbi:MAG TPA: hypothetical protein VFD58_36935 [Blastocatellia bacterium]|nr:hypothetical protein [Blastocatellia bacterium]
MSAAESVKALRDAIEGLYTAFSHYPLRPHVEGCPCCVETSDQETIRARPLRKLTGQDLEKYAFKAVTTWGSEADWKHFLPRLFELLASGPMDWDIPEEIIIGKLDVSAWYYWPAPEREAVTAYLMALWQAALSSYPCFMHSDIHWACVGEVDACLCSIGQAVRQMTPFLEVWEGDESAPALRHLAKFIYENAGTLGKRRALSNAFWKGRAVQMRQVVDWLLSPRRAATLEEAFFRYSDEPFAGEFSTAVDQLRQIS